LTDVFKEEPLPLPAETSLSVNVSSLYTHLIYFCPLNDGKRDREIKNGKKRKVDERKFLREMRDNLCMGEG